MSKAGAVLATIGGLTVAEALGIPVIDSLVNALGSLGIEVGGSIFWGIVDTLNPLNYI